MKYTVTVENEFGKVLESYEGLSKKEATEVAENASTEDNLVFVSWFRSTDHQHGYLNPDGDHAITGKTW